MKKLLWLDDMRDPFTYLWIKMFAREYENPKHEIIWVKNYKEFEIWILQNGLPDMICYDHDLGEGKTGYNAAKFVVDYCIDYRKIMPDWNVQSSNPVGKKNIDSLLMNYIKHYE